CARQGGGSWYFDVW
nr:immunoglobulin heavy chain junction region [Mus musculus]MBK4195084.1 immunoglobulin heavy chain junction region [Mus musculus]MBK4196274.1 immunoglobulin heavy chain junction region [Mus musculus]MBK4196917.1 immunoglobulin heavy chain junction region [Mus musculus]